MSDAPRTYCPGCEVDADPIADLLEVAYCGRHYPSTAGLDDAGVVRDEERPVTNAMWCALIHRARAVVYRDRAEPE
jgi:hypothetical protein